MRGVTIGLIVLGVFVTGGAVYFFWPASFSISPGPTAPSSLQDTGYTFDALGITFLYPKTYVFESYPQEDEEGPWQDFVLVAEADKISADQNGASEGPVSIGVSVFPNPDQKKLEEWVRTSKHSNFDISADGQLSPSSIGGQPALAYRYSGLYETDAVAVSWQDQIFILSVGWITADDSIRSDFENLLKTVTFK
jgi:hypothetical protein